ncbi:hypothetical protein BJF79_37385 [Actinomadura sp. CNU-125]|uniref:hypothetical protein n=1 Tax=Actinomadura sp. CNU-125 TaxID=1904961 RepID=UPI0009688A06|nr:hypothetical protein [Actinomadura sp. CNU-125]OLT31372.1 hypothetical protein BJF79_37385 [Actinomadura sp. CNU-125]
MTATPHDIPDTAPPDRAEAPRGRWYARFLTGGLPPLLAAALTLAVSLIGIRRPSLWLDEAATIRWRRGRTRTCSPSSTISTSSTPSTT